MGKKFIVILGSSRNDGDTHKLYTKVFKGIEHEFINLNFLNIGYFNYDFNYKPDDQFISLAEQLTEFPNIVLATPVYWYTMSSQMKTFFDRLSDLITIRKDIGRKLKGKRVFVLSTYGATMPIGFEETFRQTCIYLEMEYGSCLYYYTGKHSNMAAFNDERTERFIEQLHVIEDK